MRILWCIFSTLERILIKGSGGSLWQATGKDAETTVGLLHSALTSSIMAFGLVLIDFLGIACARPTFILYTLRSTHFEDAMIQFIGVLMQEDW